MNDPSNAVRTIPTPEIVFDLGDEAAELLARVDETLPWLRSDLDRLRNELPVATSVQPFAEGMWFRPENHRRAFYRAAEGPSVLAFKGTELLADDAHAVAGWVHAMHDLLDSPLEQFPMREHKAPGVLMMDEALPEAHAAALLQTRWVDRYGGLARTPLPLLVVRWPESAVEGYRSTIGPLLSRRVRGILDRLLQGGLATYVYHYPGTTTRVTTLANATGMAGFEQRQTASGIEGGFAAVCDSWIELVSRILALGFLPVSLSSDNAGQMVQVQNAIIDGGFVDMDSLQPFDDVQDDREFATSFWLLVAELAYTVRGLMGGETSRHLGGRSLVTHVAASAAVFDGIRARLRDTPDLDPRLAAIVRSGSPMEPVEALSRLHHPG